MTRPSGIIQKPSTGTRRHSERCEAGEVSDPELYNDNAYWNETVRRALDGDREAKWECQLEIARLNDQRFAGSFFINRKTGETLYTPSGHIDFLPPPLQMFAARMIADITDGRAKPRTAFLSEAPKVRDGARSSEMALRARWLQRCKGIPMDKACAQVADEYGGIYPLGVKRIVRTKVERERADEIIDRCERDNRAVPFPILNGCPFG